MDLKPRWAPALCVVAVLATACGAAKQSVHPTTTTTRAPAGVPLRKVVTAGRLTFRIPSSWTVGYGTCRCGWGKPDTATLNNGPQRAGVVCNCPAEAGDAPSGLHLYEGQAGLVSGGTPTTINGIRSLVGLSPATAALTATFPGVDEWITINAAPASSTASGTQQQVALEKEILATVKAFPGGGGAV